MLDNKAKQKYQAELDIINQKIEDIKLEDITNYKELKNLLAQREKIEFKLNYT